MFERIIKYLSIFTFSFFILSYCYLSGYYGKVNVDILNYITGSEILYTMLPGAAWVISYCGLLFFFLPGVFSFARPKPTKETQAPTESIWTKKSWPATIVGYGVMTAICLLLLNYYFENFAQLVPYILLLVSLGTCAYVFRKHIQVAVAR